MSKTPNYDVKVKAILDATQPSERICALTGEKWMMTDEEIGWYKKFNVPPSKESPNTRWKHMTGFWLSYQWWWNKHFDTGEPVLTYVHPATGVRVLHDKEWFDRDFLNALDASLDSSQAFFDQMRQLQLRVPYPAEKNAEEPQNSLARFSLGDVNSFFVMFCRSRNSLYSIGALDVENSSELNACTSVTNSYNINSSHRIYNCKFVRESFDCMDSCFLFDCRNCRNCFGATNKRNKQYLFFNEQLSQNEYEKRIAGVDFSQRSTMDAWVKKFRELMNTQAVWPENFNDQAVNSTGEYLQKTVNVKNGFCSFNGMQDSFWVTWTDGDCRNSAFCAGLFSSSDCYYSVNPVSCSQQRYSYNCGTCQDVEYCMQCYNCEYCFGCIGLNRKKFCIFNHQYTESEYWKELDKIKCAMLERGEYGEFFPLTLSVGWYPYSGSRVYMGASPELGKEKLGARDFNPDSEGAMGAELSDDSKLRQAEEIPDRIDDVNEKEWVGIPIYDPVEKRRFAFVKPEIAFYREHRIGLPRRHFIGRVQELIMESNAGEFLTASCEGCKKEVMIARNPTYLSRRILCRPCYLRYLEQHG